MKIIDCFLFNDELKYLEFRLSELYNHVDYFIILESTVDFLGKEKKSFYQDNKEKFKLWENKIINIVTDNIKTKNSLKIKLTQSNSLVKKIEDLRLHYDDIFIFSEIDEIPNLIDLNLFDSYLNYGPLFLLNEEFVYNKNNKSINWHVGSILFKYHHFISDKKIIEKQILYKHRKSGTLTNSILNGWHLSKFFDLETIFDKIILSKKIKYKDSFFKKKSNIEFLVSNLMTLEVPNSKSKLLYTESENLPLNIDILPYYNHKKNDKRVIKIDLNRFIEKNNVLIPEKELYSTNKLNFTLSYKINCLKSHLSKEFLFDDDLVVIFNKKSQFLTDFYKEFNWSDIKSKNIVDLIEEFII